MNLQSGKTMPRFPYPINSRNENAAFLVAERCENGIYIRLSARYGHKLKEYWQVWVREVLQKLPAKYALEIRIRGDHVYVSSAVALREWYWAAHNLLGTIVPLPELPMHRRYRNDHNVEWGVWRGVDLSETISAMRLPDEVNRHFYVSGGAYGVYLRVRGTSKKRDRLFTRREVAQMVELRVALACRNGYPGANQSRVVVRRNPLAASRVNVIKSREPDPRYL